jgi:hypothetical protein
MSSLILKKYFFLNNFFYSKPNNNILIAKRSLYKRTNIRKSKYLKWFIYFELACIGGSYFVWNRMNHSQDFRFFMSKNYPVILDGKLAKNKV